MRFAEEIKVLDEFVSGKGLKHSEKRAQILDVLLRSGNHITAEELHIKVRKKYPAIGQATVYRVLKLFVECGLCREVRSDDGVHRYETLYGQGHHDHLICNECGKFEEAVDMQIEKLQELLAKKKGFKLESHRMELYGICSECLGKGGKM